MPNADEMRHNAKNCAELSRDAKKNADRARYKRMEKAWNDLASTQECLDRKKTGSEDKS